MITTNIYTDLYISGYTGELSELMPRGESVRNVRNGVCVLMVVEGEACVSIDGASCDLSHGHIVLLFPFHTISSKNQSVDFKFRYLYFDFDFMSDFPLLMPPQESERFGAHPHYRADEVTFSVLNKCYDMVLGYYVMSNHPSRIGLIKAQLFTFVSELLLRCGDSARPMRTSRGDQLTADFFHLLHGYYKTERSLAFYASRLCVTTKYLSKLIRRTTGQTVYFWIGEFAVKEAKLLLRTTQATVTEIAEQLNFPNSSFFAKLFRRYTGFSPIEFRNNKP